MYSRNHTAEDYSTFCDWWHHWKWDAIPFEFFPKNSVVVCNDNDKPLCAVFLYRTDSPIIWAENYVSDKDMDKPTRTLAMDKLLFDMQVKAQELNAAAIMSSIKNYSLAKRLESVGFIKTDVGYTNYMKAV